MNETKSIKKKKRKINRVLTIILVVITILFFCFIFYINLIPIIYVILGLLIFLAIIFGIVLLNFKKKRILRIIGYIFSITIISVIIFVLYYLFNTMGFLFNMTDGDYTLNNYNIVVLNDKEYNNIKDLKNKTIGISDTSKSEELKKAKNKIDKEIKINYEEFEDLNNLVDSLIEEKTEGILLEDSEIDLIKEQDSKYNEIFKIIYEVEIKNDIEDLKNAININKEPFNLYISGIDTFGSINSSSRSDVNIVLTVNPKTEKILITWIPRDYFVKINDSNYKDKITHAGIYGIDSSIYAVSELLDIDINYYVKVNFTSLIEIINVLEGITVYNESAFTTDSKLTFNEGYISLYGDEALIYVRERKNLVEGDLGRGKNQIRVLEALIDKAMSPSIIKNYNNLLKSLDGAFITNMSHSTMISFIRMELFNKRDWSLESNSLKGINSYEYTYSYKNKELYVMKPDKDSVDDAKEKIKLVMEN